MQSLICPKILMAQVRFFLATEGSMRFGRTCRALSKELPDPNPAIVKECYFSFSIHFYFYIRMQISDGCLWPAVYEGHLIIYRIYINVYVEQSEHKICYWPHCPLGKWNPVWYFTRLCKPNQPTSTSTGFIFDRWWVSKSPFWHIYKYVLLAYSIWY